MSRKGSTYCNNVNNFFNETDDISVATLVNLEVEELGHIDISSPPVYKENIETIHPHLVDIDFSLCTDRTHSVISKKKAPASQSIINCDTLTINDTDNSKVTESQCINVPQHVDIDVRQPFFSEYSTIDVPVCDDLVDLSPCEVKGNEMQSSEIVFNTDLEGIIFPVSNPTESYIDKHVPESLIPFQIGEFKYPDYAYIVDNLAYDVIFGADLLTHYQSVINSDTGKLQVAPPVDTPPPTDTPPPCPIPS
jgi:hypothetical protein